MKCAEMLTLLLEAEREELEGKGTSLVASHVRECARCRAVASQLLSDTMVLTAHTAGRGVSAMPARPRSRRPLVWSGAVAAAAALALMVMPVRTAQRIPLSEPAHVQVAAHLETRSEKPVSALVRMRPVRFQAVSAATPVRFVASQTMDEPMTPVDSNGVSVASPAGTRSAVLATRNSKITVVWLY